MRSLRALLQRHWAPRSTSAWSALSFPWTEAISAGDVPFFAKQSFSRARLLFPPLLCAAHRQPRTSLSAIASCSPFKTLGTAFLRGRALLRGHRELKITARGPDFFSWARLLFPPLCAAHQPEQQQGPCDARARSQSLRALLFEDLFS